MSGLLWVIGAQGAAVSAAIGLLLFVPDTVRELATWARTEPVQAIATVALIDLACMSPLIVRWLRAWREGAA